MAQEFFPVVAKRHPAVPFRTTSEAKYWARFRVGEDVEFPSSVTHVEFSPTEPHDIAVTASSRVTILDGRTMKINRLIGSFKDVAYGASFKKDGRLLVVGGENASIQIFDVQKRSRLRTFHGHTAAVHTTLFSVDGRRVISGSDDHTVKIWDVATSKQICTLDGHRDYVRAQTSSDMSPHLWITGCYDHMFRMFDLRQQKCIFTLDHGYPIEAVLRLGSGGLVVTAGGPEVRVHELFSGGKLLQRLHNHSKAVTSACLDSSGKRLLTGGLDQQMKVHDLSTFEVEASMLFKDQILSLAMSPDGTKLGAGLASGVCTVKAYAKKPEKINEMKQSESVPLAQRRRSEEVSLFMKLSRGEELKKQGPRPGSRAYLNRGRYEGPEEGDTVVGSKGRRKRKDYDVYLRKFMYGAALDKAMACGNSPTLIAVLEDLIHRNGLTIALKHRGAERLVPVLKLINSCLTNPKYTELMLLVANETLDMYGGIVGRSQEVDQILKKIHITLKEEVRLQNNLMMLLGLMDIAVGGKAEQQRSVELEDVD